MPIYVPPKKNTVSKASLKESSPGGAFFPKAEGATLEQECLVSSTPPF